MPKHTTTELEAEFSIDGWDEQPLVADTDGTGELRADPGGKVSLHLTAG